MCYSSAYRLREVVGVLDGYACHPFVDGGESIVNLRYHPFVDNTSAAQVGIAAGGDMGDERVRTFDILHHARLLEAVY